MGSIFDGSDNVVPNREARGETTYLNRLTGTHTLTIERAEISKNGTHVVAEFELNGGKVTDLFDLSPKSGRDSWKRDRALADVRAFVAAALSIPFAKATQARLDEVFADGSLAGLQVIATVAPNEAGYNRVSYSRA